MQTPAPKQAINSLTGIRIILAFLLFLYHLQLYVLKFLFPDVAYHITVPFNHTAVGVDMFFILSGFIIAYNYFDTFAEASAPHYKIFIIHRLARIYPDHLFTTLLLAVVFLLNLGLAQWSGSGAANAVFMTQPYVDVSLSKFLQSVFLVQGWTLPTTISWNAVSWSVSCEWLVYLLFPLIVALVKPFSNSVLKLGIVFWVVYLLGLVAGFFSVRWQGLSLLGIIRVIPEFIMGVVVYHLYRNSSAADMARRYSPWLVYPLLLLALASLYFRASFLWLVPFFAWLVLALTRGQIALSFLSSKPFLYGGVISYAFYLCHGAVLVLLVVFFSPEQFSDSSVLVRLLYIAGFLFASLALTIAVYHGVEEPCRRYIVRRFAR